MTDDRRVELQRLTAAIDQHCTASEILTIIHAVEQHGPVFTARMNERILHGAMTHEGFARAAALVAAELVYGKDRSS